MIRQKHITIIGAGLVGSLLAEILNRRGYRVTVYEKRPDMRRTSISAGRSINLALAQRGINALRIGGMMDDVEPLLIPMRGRMLHELDSDPEFFPYGQREYELIYSVSRGELNNLMMTAAERDGETTIHFNHELKSIDLKNNRIEVYDTENKISKTETYDFLIGADGGGSKVRQPIMDATHGNCTADMLDHDYKELEIQASATGGWRIEKEALHIWPRGGFMLIALPNLDGSFTVTLFLPAKGQPGFDNLKNKSQVSNFFETYFPNAIPLLPNLIDDFFDNPTGELGTIRSFPWTSHNAMLIGDAAHAIVPFHGQGMNCGFEDCAKLNALLDEFDDDWQKTAEKFQHVRKPDADAIADMALENYVIMRDRVSDPKFRLKKEIGFLLEREFPQQFIPRYSMVMFHDIPYAEAFRRGQLQDAILEKLIRTDGHPDVDMLLASRLINEQLTPLEFAF